jgi:lipopolysaccharide transport system ATP-binding protein
MTQPAIRVEGLGKKYQITHETRGRYKTLRETVMDAAAAPVRWMKGERGTTQEEFWALKDVSFEVQPGEVVGIIGRNGAGKSTLLKVLSRITKPTKGRVELNGRVGSLLEVGTGFHPELTGRENVYLNGSILGMTRREIERKFDEIVAFAEVEKFLDTPVKRYSSGMYVRLAFAVAAHLEPEILIVDEVLAVGDQAFQKRCLGKMREVSRSGRTVIFVSHNMSAVQALCSMVVILGSGSVRDVGAPGETIAKYLQEMAWEVSAEYDLTRIPRASGKQAIFERIRLSDSLGTPAAQIPCGEDFVMEFDCRLPYRFVEPQIGVGIDDSLGQRIASVGTFLSTTPLPPAENCFTARCILPRLPLAPGRYTLSLSIGNLQNPLMDQVEHLVGFEVTDGDFYGNGRPPIPGLGQTLLNSEWEASRVEQISKTLT